MKKIALSTLLLLFIAAPAYAQNQAAFCKLCFTHKAKSADYKPGVDVNGNAVVPADVNGSAQAFSGDTINFPLTVDLAEMLQKTDLPAGTEMNAGMGMVNIKQNGKVTLNGANITNNAIEVCTGEKPMAKAPVEPEIPLVKAPKAPKAEVTGTASVDGTMPSMVKPEQKTDEDGIIWGQDY